MFNLLLGAMRIYTGGQALGACPSSQPDVSLFMKAAVERLRNHPESDIAEDTRNSENESHHVPTDSGHR